MNRGRRGQPCEYCEGRLRPKRVTEYEERNGRGLLLIGVPVRQCDRCGERYYDASVVRWMEEAVRGDRKAKREVRVPILKYTA